MYFGISEIKNLNMKRLLIIILGLFPLLGNCQITISSSDMPSANDTLRYSTALNVSASLYEASGPNQTWDFSSVEPASQDIYSYKSSLQTSYAFFFLGFNKYGLKIADTLGVAAFQFTDVYNFFKKSNSAYEVEGIGLKYQGLPLPAYYSEKDKLYQFPLQYGDRDSSGLKFSISLSTLASYSQVGYRINEVVGWGSVTTPFGTFNCLKLKSSVFSADSINLGGFPVKLNRRIVEYKWLANGQKIPVMEISGNMIGNNFVPGTIRYRDIKRSNTLLDPPVANFSASPLTADINQMVSFQNTSTGNFMQYKWTFTPAAGVNFENGTSDTSKLPEVSFGNPGLYSVKLRASNFIGNNEMNKNNYIQVLDPNSVSSPEQNFKLIQWGNSQILIPQWVDYNHISVQDLTGRPVRFQIHGNQLQADPNHSVSILIMHSSNGKNVWFKKVVNP